MASADSSSDSSKSDRIAKKADKQESIASQNDDLAARWRKSKEYLKDLVQRSNKEHFNCMRNLVWCTKYNPYVRTLVDALTEKGCPPKIDRHMVCARCNPESKWNGWFDVRSNHVVVCENKATSTIDCCGILARELLHAYDACRAQYNDSDLRHVACAEIRKINFLHCPFSVARHEGYASVINVKDRKKACVKDRALQTLMADGNVNEAAARNAIDEVFERCYADLSPFWRHPRAGSLDGPRAYFESRGFNSDSLDEEMSKKGAKKRPDKQTDNS